MTFAYEDRVVGAGSECFDGRSGLRDAWSADEYHLERAPGKCGFAVEDGGVDLTTVGVALYGDVERAEGFLGRVCHISGEQDDACAGPERGRFVDEILEDFEEAALLEELKHRCGFTAGHDEAVEAFEVGGQANELRRSAKFGDYLRVGVIGALQGKNPDGEIVSVA